LLNLDNSVTETVSCSATPALWVYRAL
jgi:hypothetical protein